MQTMVQGLRFVENCFFVFSNKGVKKEFLITSVLLRVHHTCLKDISVQFVGILSLKMPSLTLKKVIFLITINV